MRSSHTLARIAPLDRYSPTWYETFLASIPAEGTRSELAFVERQLPVAAFPAVLDLCCGPARHAVGLVERGYRVVGVDANDMAVREARAACPRGRFEVGDMRALAALELGTFDAVLNLWHSFGYFDDDANRAVLRAIRDALRPGGRAILDVYNREHFERRPAVEHGERGGRRFRVARAWRGARERIAIEYDGEPGDTLEWRLYSPDELRAECAGAGLTTLRVCAWFDEARAASAEHARMQLVLERTPTTICAGGLLVRGGRVLLARRSERRASYPGVWDVPGGHCEPGETPEQALVRELGEEIGVRPTAFEAHETGDLGELRLHVFVVRGWEGEPRLANDEHSELRWVDADEAAALPLAHPSYLMMLRAALARAAR